LASSATVFSEASPCSGICQNSPRRSGRCRGSTEGKIGIFRYGFFGGISCSGICQNSPRRSGRCGGCAEGRLASSATVFSEASPCSGICQNSPRRSGRCRGRGRGRGNEGEDWHLPLRFLRRLLPVAEFAKIPRVGRADAGAARREDWHFPPPLPYYGRMTSTVTICRPHSRACLWVLKNKSILPPWIAPPRSSTTPEP